MAKNKFTTNKKPNLFAGVSYSALAKSLEQNSSEDFLISFRYLDRNQGETLEEWE